MENEVDGLQERLVQVERERDGFRNRLQNLEAIVTSPSFEALENEAARIELPPEESEEEEAMRRAAQMARRLNGM